MKHSLLALTLLLSVTLGTVSYVNAATQFCQPLNWSDYGQLAVWDDLSMAFVAEGRIANNGLSGDHELDVGYSTGAPAATAQRLWVSGTVYDFSLTFNSATRLVTWTVGGVSCSFTYDPANTNPGNGIPISNLNALMVRARSDSAGQSMIVSNLELDGMTIGCTASATGAYPGQFAPAGTPGDGLELIYIYSDYLQDGFTLTGKATMTWTGSPPTGSRIAFQVKAGDPFHPKFGLPVPKPVGGVVLPINKLEILVPYLVLTGLIATVLAIVTVKRRNKD